MIAVLQRVYNATVYADGEFSGKINKGLYILLGVEQNDTEKDADLLSEKISKLRIFSDEDGKMNLSPELQRHGQTGGNVVYYKPKFAPKGFWI